MAERGTSIFDRLTAGFTGWLLTATGALVISAMVLWPAYRNLSALRWQQGLLQMQLQRLTQQQSGYEQIRAAIERGDRDLMLQLAYHELRRQAADMQTLDAERPIGFVAPPLQHVSTFERWTHQPAPRVGVDYPALRHVESLMTRLLDGPLRSVALAVALLCVLLGLWLPTLPKRQDPAAAMSR